MHFAWFRSNFLRVLKFLEIKHWVPISWETNFGEYLNYLVLLSVFQSQTFYGPKFFVIHYISRYSAWFRSIYLRVLNFLEIKEGGAKSGGNHFCRMSELFRPRFCISMLKVLWTQVLRHSLHFNEFCMIQE